MIYPRFDSFSVIGINHRGAPVEVREKFSLNTKRKMALLKGARRRRVTSLFVISTCNRTEIVARQTKPHDLIRLLTIYSGGSLEEFHKYGFEYQGRRAVEHLFKVSTGLDSQILGDLQVVKQVKEGYELSAEQEMLDGVMHRLMQHVFRAHKRSRNETSLGSGAATLAYAAVKFANRTFSSLVDKNILLVGTGKLGTLICKNLLNRGARNLTLINRTRVHADFLANRFDLEVADMEHLPLQIAKADLVIVATGSNDPVISIDHMQKSLEQSKCKVMLDLSVPRNIDPEVGGLDYVDLANMDLLSDTTDQTYRKREKEIPQVKKIIEEELEEYGTWLREQRVVPTIKALMNRLNMIRDDEMDFFRNKISSQDVDKVENLTRRIVNKMAAYSIEHLRAHHQSGEVIKMVEDMYKLRVEITANEI